ncbi:hypothetical protein PLESTF_001421500 [Pleodorina starrii]|nr:hypothetical protein PLESTF_001421500 [Pleodorina starrii]
MVQSDEPGSMTGPLTSVDTHGPQHRHPTYYLHSRDGIIYRIVFCPSLLENDIPVGTTVTITYDKIVDGVVYSCSLPKEPAEQRQRRRVLLGDSLTTPNEPRILVFLVSFCGFDQPPAVSSKDVTNLLVEGNGTYMNRSLAGYYNTCTYGRVTLNPANVKVLGPVEVPCKGGLKAGHPFSTGPNFTSSACDELDNMPKWHYWLDEWAKNKTGVSAGDYHHRVIILPRNFSAQIKGCNGFSGAATPGRWPLYTSSTNQWGTSFIWWAGENFGDLEILFHEIGHTYGMAHATVPGNCDLFDQCDHTCTMGATGGQGIRCFNAPHNWQVGWGRPLRQFDDNGLKYGNATSVQIPSQLTAVNSSVMITGNGLPNGQRLFIAARINIYPYELPWAPWDDNKAFLVMHTYNGTDACPGIQTVWVGEIQEPVIQVQPPTAHTQSPAARPQPTADEVQPPASQVQPAAGQASYPPTAAQAVCTASFPSPRAATFLTTAKSQAS